MFQFKFNTIGVGMQALIFHSKLGIIHTFTCIEIAVKFINML